MPRVPARWPIAVADSALSGGAQRLSTAAGAVLPRPGDLVSPLGVASHAVLSYISPAILGPWPLEGATMRGRPSLEIRPMVLAWFDHLLQDVRYAWRALRHS